MRDCAVIDIGSNSVRLMLIKGNNTQKFVNITQLGQGVAKTGLLSESTMALSLKAICEFKSMAGDIPVYAFATEAVRRAENGKDFVNQVLLACGIKIDVLSPEDESRAGFLGASGNSLATVIDIGGASTEFCSGDNGEILHAVSTPVGAVSLKDVGDNRDICGYLDSLFKDFNFVGKIVGIGGTITALTAMARGLDEYDKNAVHGYLLRLDEIESIIDRLSGKTVDEIVNLYPVLPQKRAKVIYYGARILSYVMKRYGIDYIEASDSDNTEGYLILRNYEG